MPLLWIWKTAKHGGASSWETEVAEKNKGMGPPREHFTNHGDNTKVAAGNMGEQNHSTTQS